VDRIKLLQIIILACGILILSRLLYWQFIAGTKLTPNALLLDSEIPASRGEIYTSDNFPIVANQEAFLVYAKPTEIEKNTRDVAKILAPNLISEKYATASSNFSEEELKQKEDEIKIKEEELEKKLGSKNLVWVQLARKVSKNIKEKIENEKIKGLGFERDEKRFYAEASMSAQLLGFVGSDKFGRDTGYFGLEGYYDLQLKGKNGQLGQEKDPFGLAILVGKYRPITPEKGASLYTSIDRAIQFIVEDKLRQAVTRYGAKEGSVIIADPKTGKILAMATFPAYSPAFREEFDEKFYKNPVVADTFEPGSIFKPIVMASALDLSLIEPDTKCDICSGPTKIGGFEISTWNKKYNPDSSMTEVIIHSDNIGMTFVAKKMGADRFYNYITRFGFGKTTKIDLQEESPGFIRPKDEWKEIDLATSSFGQGIAVTPIQIVQAISAIANGGKLVTPKVVTKIDDGGRIQQIESISQKQVIKSKTATQITEMMVSAVELGESRVFAPKGYRIAGKTGTAQIPVAGHYDPNKTIASFVGFAPAQDPKFVMLVRFTEPSSSPFGSETAAPTFFEIAKEIFTYFGISPQS